jgi:hypothetical protein
MEKDRFILGSRLGQGLFPPGQPVHRIEGMLQQLGALLVDQAVGLLTGRKAFPDLPDGCGFPYLSKKRTLPALARG